MTSLDISTNNISKMDMKLSDIFDYADKNISHTRWSLGRASKNQACAIGAVAFVLSGGKTTYSHNLKKIDPTIRERYRTLLREFRERDKYHLNLVFYNDFLFYSWKKLADKCRSLGL